MNKLFIAVMTVLFLTAVHAKEDEPAFEELIAKLAATEMKPITTEESIIRQPSFARHITPKQAELLTLAEIIAKQDGHTEPRLLQGLLMQETHAGANPHYLKSPGGNHGVGQIRVVAARHVLRDYPELMSQFNVSPKDEKGLVKKLVHDNHFNVSIMSKYLLILRKAGFNTMKQLALAYNQGAGGAKKQNSETFPYVKGVMKHIKDIFS